MKNMDKRSQIKTVLKTGGEIMLDMGLMETFFMERISRGKKKTVREKRESCRGLKICGRELFEEEIVEGSSETE